MKNSKKIILFVSLLCASASLLNAIDGVKSGNLPKVEKALKNKNITLDEVQDALKESREIERDIRTNRSVAAAIKKDRSKITELLQKKLNELKKK